MPTHAQEAPSAHRGRSRAALWEVLGLFGVGGLTAYFLSISWLKWPDPLIDYGRELYLPWRLANGAVLYRDAEDSYGPLSQYLDAALFRVFGPGLHVLVAADLLVFLSILASIYVLIRRAWGVTAALAAAAVFVAVFGFSQFSIGNYNYATPYSHEATHGLLACLALLFVANRWVRDATASQSFLAGALLGLTAVLKLEFVLAAGALTAAAVATRALQRRPPGWSLAGSWAAGVVAPTALFWGYFSLHVPAGEALSYACRVWINVFGSRGQFTAGLERSFIGFDHPAAHLAQHLEWTAGALALVAAVAGGAFLAGGVRPRAGKALAWAALVGACVGLAWGAVDWFEIGRCLLGLTLVYTCVNGARVMRAARAGVDAGLDVRRLFFAVLAAALMARMVLYGRVYHYGFYQAALAALLVVAVLVGELPGRLGLDRPSRVLLAAAYLLMVGIGVRSITAHSRALLALKTLRVGSGVDSFYAFQPEFEPTGEFVKVVSEKLAGSPPGATLLVLPEGVMVNYLARLPSTVRPFYFFSATTSGGQEDEIVRALEARPPDFVAFISRDLREYGVTRYGESRGEGRQILEWVGAHYRLDSAIGDEDFLDSRLKGAAIMSRKR
jgi:hypothetical protein